MLLTSCLDRNEKEAANAIASIVNARECRVIHSVLYETIEGVELEPKNVVLLKIEDVAQFDSIRNKELVTSIAALRYFQWQDEGLLIDYDGVTVDAKGKGVSYKTSYMMSELSEASAAEVGIEKCMQRVREHGFFGLASELDTASLSELPLIDFKNGLLQMDSLHGSVDVAKVLGFRFVLDEHVLARSLVFGVYLGNEQNGGEYLELTVDPITQRITAVNTFDPW